MSQELPATENIEDGRQAVDDHAASSPASKAHQNKTVELLVWDAPSRQFDPKSPQWFLGLMGIGIVCIVIFAVLRDIWLILLTGSIIFVYYALARVEPTDIEHRVLNTGIEISGRLYSWEDLKSFSLGRNGSVDILKLETKMVFPHALELLLPEETDIEELSELKELLIHYLPYEEKPHSEIGGMADHAILSFAGKLPFREKMLGWVEKRLNSQSSQ